MLAVWGALFFNVLAFSGSPTIIAIPEVVGQLLTQGSLVLAVLLALVVNPRAVLRPNLFLVLMTMLGVVALMVSIHSDYILGSTFRACRLLGFLLVVWLLTPWWGRRDMLLLRCHRRWLWVVLGTVFAGAALAPGLAFSFEGRLAGVLWPIPATQVAHYAAVLFGTTAVLWMCRVITGRHALLALGLSGAALVSTHTRTALVAGLVALLVAGASLFLGHVRARRISALGAVLAVVVTTVFASEVTTWILRGQTTQEVSQLTGRTKVWSAVFETVRPKLEQLFGSGLSDQSFNGLPIDSNWVATYLDQGWFGLVVEASVLLLLLLMAATHKPGPQRAAALFLIVYCLIASITETGLGTASPYLLDLAVAASLLAPEVRPPQVASHPVRSRTGSTSEPAEGARQGSAHPPLSASLGPVAREPAPEPVVNINAATKAELQQLPGVGPVIATAILDWRSDNGPFTEVDELLEVPGAGEAKVAKIAPLVTLEETDK